MIGGGLVIILECVLALALGIDKEHEHTKAKEAELTREELRTANEDQDLF